MCWMPALDPGPYTLRQPSRQLLCRASWPLGHDPSAKRVGPNCKVSGTRYSTDLIIDRKPIPHWSVYTWHWRKATIFVRRRYGTMFPCPGIKVNSHYEQIVPRTGCQYWTLGPTVWAKWSMYISRDIINIHVNICENKIKHSDIHYVKL